jgi:hypothetical protein
MIIFTLQQFYPIIIEQKAGLDAEDEGEKTFALAGIRERN